MEPSLDKEGTEAYRNLITSAILRICIAVSKKSFDIKIKKTFEELGLLLRKSQSSHLQEVTQSFMTLISRISPEFSYAVKSLLSPVSGEFPPNLALVNSSINAARTSSFFSDCCDREELDQLIGLQVVKLRFEPICLLEPTSKQCPAKFIEFQQHETVFFNETGFSLDSGMANKLLRVNCSGNGIGLSEFPTSTPAVLRRVSYEILRAGDLYLIGNSKLKIVRTDSSLFIVAMHRADSRNKRTFEILKDSTIGRTQANDITLEDNYLSSTHARVQKAEQSWYIKDENSMNGLYKFLHNKTTVLGKQPSDSVVLYQGDSVYCSSVQYKVILR